AVMDQGSMAVFQDPTGAVFAVWQSGKHKGAEVVNAPGSFSWNELATRDMNAAKNFYPKVFGWTPKANPMPDGSEYTEWQLKGKSIGGGMSMGQMYPPTCRHIGWCTSRSTIPTIRSSAHKRWVARRYHRPWISHRVGSP